MHRILSGLGMVGSSSTSASLRSERWPFAAVASSGRALAAMTSRKLGHRPPTLRDRSTMPPSTTAPNFCASAWRKLTKRMEETLGGADQLCEPLRQADALDRRWPASEPGGLLL